MMLALGLFGFVVVALLGVPRQMGLAVERRLVPRKRKGPP